ncbi:MAG: lytic transglycosylase domain-containing protein [Ruminococcaceae bacterium]|nr:lytic transglycosylase domain-containing protein [Oscillospiraceae bacterium]
MKIKWKKWVLLLIVFVLLLNTTTIARVFYPVKYMNYIKESCEMYQVDPYLIMSIIKSESNFKKDAVSRKNATGLMQIMEPTAYWLAERNGLSGFDYENITDPAINIQLGCSYVAYLLELYDGDEKNALAAYNAGEGTVSRWLSDPKCSNDGKTLHFIPYPETRHYIRQVSANKKVYTWLYEVRSAVIV